MRVFMTGGTGFVGRTLARAFIEKGHEVTVLTRSLKNPGLLPQGAGFLVGDPTEPGPWQKEVANHDVIVNLAGASIFSLWTKRRKEAIKKSRIRTTKNLVMALKARKGLDTVFLSASAVGYYGHGGDEVFSEESPPGDGFLARLAGEWERVALEAETLGCRVLLCRFGVVLGTEGGAFPKMISVFRWGLGSRLGGGNQWFSWIHERDLARIFLFLAERKDAVGPVNFTAPEPIRNRDLTGMLGKALGRPTFLPPVPTFLIKTLAGEFGRMLLEGQRALPKKLMGMGFQFEFPCFMGAVEDLVRPGSGKS
ncbi:MAG: TIGR01777 family oxidoreductase [Deltaproteobacteria bacterium]|nr:TIGR01777 family oxidoreductase [Deltaproteobacteria bacterium]